MAGTFSSSGEELKNAPLISAAAYEALLKRENAIKLQNYALLGRPVGSIQPDARIFLSTSATWSAFICGSQSSGKSDTVARMLETCLWFDPQQRLGDQQNMLSGLLFHYDRQPSTGYGIPCEAASMATLPGLKVEVLCSLSSFPAMRKQYSKFQGVTVKPLILNQKDLDDESLLCLMGADNDETNSPLNLQIPQQVLREMNAVGCEGNSIDWKRFKAQCLKKTTDQDQTWCLQMRLEIINRFLEDIRPNIDAKDKFSAHEWDATPGHLTIVDLSDPLLNANTACSLFEICLRKFQKLDTKVSKVIALDEAHKFMTDSAISMKLNETLIAAVRVQRSYDTRIIVATQEPTISPRLLDLCSIALIHYLSNPAWYESLKSHLSATAQSGTSSDPFEQITQLNDREALLWAPMAMVERNVQGWGAAEYQDVLKKLGERSLKVRIRQRRSDY